MTQPLQHQPQLYLDMAAIHHQQQQQQEYYYPPYPDPQQQQQVYEQQQALMSPYPDSAHSHSHHHTHTHHTQQQGISPVMPYAQDYQQFYAAPDPASVQQMYNTQQFWGHAQVPIVPPSTQQQQDMVSATNGDSLSHHHHHPQIFRQIQTATTSRAEGAGHSHLAWQTSPRSYEPTAMDMLMMVDGGMIGMDGLPVAMEDPSGGTASTSTTTTAGASATPPAYPLAPAAAAATGAAYPPPPALRPRAASSEGAQQGMLHPYHRAG